MHKRIILILLVLSIIFATQSFALTGAQLLKKVDDNMLFGTAKYKATMVIMKDLKKNPETGKEEAGVVRKKGMIMYSQGRDKAYAEFTYPKRDKGVKYLKIDNNLWMYMPSVEKVIKIAGHMLRKSMMGSDMSYEDSMESDSLVKKYKATIVGSEKINGHPCYVVELTAKVKDVYYYKRKIWIDKVRYIGLREELFAKSGKLLKTTEISKVANLGNGRYYPTFMTMRNKLQKNTRTDFIIDEIKLNIKLPAGIFSQRNLRKG